MDVRKPRTLNAAVVTAIWSMLAAFSASVMYLLVLFLFIGADEYYNAESLQASGEEFKPILTIALVIGTLVVALLAVGVILTVLSKQAGRPLLIAASSVAIAWNLACGCASSIRWMSSYDPGTVTSADTYYLGWQFTSAVILGYLASLLSMVTIILLVQRSVGEYFHALRWAAFHE